MGTEEPERHRPDQTTSSSRLHAAPAQGRSTGAGSSSSRMQQSEPGQDGEADPLDFEAALGRLDELVEVLEQGRISLEEALQLYEEGVLMADRCQRLLDQAQVRLQRLSVVNNAVTDAAPDQTFVLESFRLDEDI
jgi:exodeoxyribonuclease VII small subunit